MSDADRAELFRETKAGFSSRRVAVWPEAARPLVSGVEDATTVSLVNEDDRRLDDNAEQAPAGRPCPMEKEEVDQLRVPILVGGRSWGELRLFARRRRPKDRSRRWPPSAIRPLETLCALVAGVEIGMTSALESIPFDPTLDPLTGRPNAAFLKNALPLLLAFARRRGEPLTLLHIVAERLDVVREVHGPSIADALLRRLSQAVTATLRAGDLVARLDTPDTFVVVLSGAPIADARGVVIEAVRRAVVEAGIASAAPLSISIGIAGFPDHGHDAKLLLSAARAAAEFAQSRGTNQVAVALPPKESSTISQSVPSAIPSSPRARRATSHHHSSAAITKVR